MQGCCRPFRIDRLVPLTISRGQTRCLERLLVEVRHGGITGLGETGHVDTGHHRYSSQAVAAELARLWPQLEPYAPHQWQRCEPLLAPLSPPAAVGWTWRSGTGGANHWDSPSGVSGVWIGSAVGPPA